VFITKHRIGNNDILELLNSGIPSTFIWDSTLSIDRELVPIK
jgi:hypothetical protein